MAFRAAPASRRHRGQPHGSAPRPAPVRVGLFSNSEGRSFGEAGILDVHPVRRADGRIGAFSINFPSALSVDNRLVMPCADRFRTAPIKTEDRPAALNSSNRRSSVSPVQNLLYLPGMATIVNLPVSGTGSGLLFRDSIVGSGKRFVDGAKPFLCSPAHAGRAFW